MAEMMWAGRSSQGVDSRVNAFNSSIAFDGRMYKQDIQGSIAHATMLGEQGIISMSDSLELIGGLKEILADIESGTLQFDMTAEDIHMFIEAELTKRLGDVGKRLHTSRSRNDQVALDIRLYLRDAIGELRELWFPWLGCSAISLTRTPKQSCRDTPTSSALSPSLSDTT